MGQSSRFFDAPEFTPFHDIGNNQTIFDRLDLQPTAVDAIHLNVFMARNWSQIPNSYDQLSQDQRQRVLTWNVAPGYQHTFNSHMLLTVSPYARKDQFNYYPSTDPLNDTPSTTQRAAPSRIRRLSILMPARILGSRLIRICSQD
jgi:hypothetical protein